MSYYDFDDKSERIDRKLEMVLDGCVRHLRHVRDEERHEGETDAPRVVPNANDRATFRRYLAEVDAILEDLTLEELSDPDIYFGLTGPATRTCEAKLGTPIFELLQKEDIAQKKLQLRRNKEALERRTPPNA